MAKSIFIRNPNCLDTTIVNGLCDSFFEVWRYRIKNQEDQEVGAGLAILLYFQ